MLKRKAEMEHEWKQGIWGGKGTLDLCKVFTPEELGGRANCFNVVTLQPGDSIGLHSHVTDAEVYYVLSGELTVDDNGTEVQLKAGDAVFTADGDVHSAENRTDQEAQMLAVIFPQ